jgi:hypothetical protein
MAEEKTTPHEDDGSERRRQLKKAHKALESLRGALAEIGAGTKTEVAALLSALEDEIEALRPAEPRKCKEYQRALGRAKKGLLGVSPEDVALYCRCAECTSLRAQRGMAQPAGPLEIEDEGAPQETSA